MSCFKPEVLLLTFVAVLVTFCTFSSAVEDRLSSNLVTEKSSLAADQEILPQSVSPGLPVSSPAPKIRSGVPKKVCQGTNFGFAHLEDQSVRYDIYKTLYTNCTHVDGNVEIVFLTNVSLDLSFLQNIQEITGYVLIVANFLDVIPLRNLRIIRGKTRFDHENIEYSLYIALNYDNHQSNIGLKELQFTSLHEIMAGNVFLYDNPFLCYHNTIDWKDIMSDPNSKVYFNSITDQKQPTSRSSCGKCHDNCTSGRCWGSGAEHCQELTRVSCSLQCDGHCFGPGPSQCCHRECAGGCTGPGNSHCWSCKVYDNGGICEMQCPPLEIYSPQQYRMIPNPNGKYAYGSLCVDQCPSHLVADKDACVQDCGPGKIAGKDGKCHDCVGPCPKTCQLHLDSSDFINSNNIKNYTGCTIIQGSLKILDTSFVGDRFKNSGPMRLSQLSILESVQEVTEFVQIQAYHSNFRNLNFLRNLRVIHGQKLDSGRASLQIFKTSLESLGLESLEEIRFGHIYVANNSRLCYASSVKWDKLRSKPEQKIIVEHNRNATSCAQDYEVCASECMDDGCWGPDDSQCVSCKNFHLGKRCIESCNSMPGIFESGEKECQKCHEQCKSNCKGPGPDKCDNCKYATDGPYCVAKCPETKYMDENKVCQPCHQNCESGCTGPKSSVGPGGCNSCSLAIFLDDDKQNSTECLAMNSVCPDGYYQQKITDHPGFPNLDGKEGCMKCHPQCATCTGYGATFCTTCRHYRQGDECVPQCDRYYFVSPDDNVCHRCDPQCLGCHGPTASDCVTCKLYKVYLDYNARETNPTFNCTESCPDFSPHKVQDEKTMETVCVAEDNEAVRQRRMILSIIFIVIGVFAIILIVAAVLCWQRMKTRKSAQKLTNQMDHLYEAEPLKLTTAQPDMSQMLIMSESELKWGTYILGSGAFGTVYKGVWTSRSMLVAIKVLQEGGGQSEEFLDEARIMCSVIHPCCVSILGICLSAKMMLITQLMPHGCLLEYVRQNKRDIGARMLLKWCRQIAEGMKHLESRGIVHCDLAARNVLVESPDQVKITDFGLAKMLEYGHCEFQFAGGKMPIKWLAIESMTALCFTHKSDVWSFGVTLWELFTFGKRPYESMHHREILMMLERGERLSQPSICSIQVFMLMSKCWLAEPERRPQFEQLVNELLKMEQDPDRFLHIPVNESSSKNEDGDAQLEYYIEPKGSVSVRYTGQPTANHGQRIESNHQKAPFLEDGLVKDPKPSQLKSRFSNPLKTPVTSAEFNYEVMSPDLANQSDQPLLQRCDVSESDVVPSRTSLAVDASYSGGSSPADSYGLSETPGSDYFSMSKTHSVMNPEYFDTFHDPAAHSKCKLRHADPSSDGRTVNRPRIDSVGFTESERSSTEESEHEYYNFYNAPVRGLHLG